MKSTADIVRIINFGGGVIVDASIGTDNLVKIASHAASSGGRVIVKNANKKLTDHLVRIASFGKGAVMFDLTK